MLNRRALLQRGAAAANGALAITTVPPTRSHPVHAAHPALLVPDPATLPDAGTAPNPAKPADADASGRDGERAELAAFDTLDVEVFSHTDGACLGESHAQSIRVHWPDGHYTEGIDRHIGTRPHCGRVGTGHPGSTCTRSASPTTSPGRCRTRPAASPSPRPAGRTRSTCAPSGGWNRQGMMREEFLPWDTLTLLPDRPGLSARHEGRARTGHG